MEPDPRNTPVLTIRKKKPVNVSFLYTPAVRVDSLNRHDVAADVIVIDLEDSVHVNAKTEAREKVAAFDFSAFAAAGIRLGLRVNYVGSFDGLRDLELLRTLYEQGHCAFEYILLPKMTHPSEIRIYRSLFGSLRQSPKLISFIETLEAVENVDAIASASDAICLGQADLSAQMYSPNPAFLDYARARICVAAARHHIQAIDTNSFEINDMARFERECVAAKECGFTGKAAIHPRQIDGINRIFSVSADTVDCYQKTIEAYVSASTGFALKDGQVIAPPFVAKARMMLEAYDKWSSE
ncbi:MAG TPA: CoA ester lyase [Thermoanaerobaculia bacterium]|nr:CoA ester lyase [Thermoanaerobaculia bacterium]